MNTVKRFRKRPALVEAIEWTGVNTAEVEEFIGRRTVECLDEGGRAYLQIAIEATIRPGGIIMKSQGWFHAWPRDEFDATYEPVEEQADD